MCDSIYSCTVSIVHIYKVILFYSIFYWLSRNLKGHMHNCLCLRFSHWDLFSSISDFLFSKFAKIFPFPVLSLFLTTRSFTPSAHVRQSWISIGTNIVTRETEILSLVSHFSLLLVPFYLSFLNSLFIGLLDLVSNLLSIASYRTTLIPDLSPVVPRLKPWFLSLIFVSSNGNEVSVLSTMKISTGCCLPPSLL